MEITEFRNQVKIGMTSQYIKGLLQGYLESDLSTFDSKDGVNLFDLFRVDSNNVRLINNNDCKNFYNTLITDFKNTGFDSQLLLSSINQFPDKITIDMNYILKGKNSSDLEQKIMLNIAGNELYSILAELYSMGINENLNLYMEIPAMDKQGIGYKDNLTLYVSTENIDKVLEMLNRLNVSNKVKFGPVINYMPSYNGIMSYDTYNPAYGKWVSTIIGEALINAIDKTIYEWVKFSYDDNYSLEKTNDIFSKSYQKDLNRKIIVNYMEKIGYKAIDKIVGYFMTYLIDRGISTTNMFMSNSVDYNMKKIYGVDIEEQVIEIPEVIIEYEQTIDLNDSVQNEDKLTEIVEESIQLFEKNPQGEIIEEYINNSLTENLKELTPSIEVITEEQTPTNYVQEEANIEPLEENARAQITDAEVNAILAAMDETIVDNNEFQESNGNQNINVEKYDYISDSLSFFLSEIETGKTIYDFLEENNISDIIPKNAIVITEEGTYSPGQFIVNDFIKYVLSNGSISINDYLEMLNIQIKIPKEKKNSFIGKIFSSH